MARLEEITVGTSVKGVLPDGLVTVVAVDWIGTVAINLTYRDSGGRLGSELLYRDREPTLEVAVAGQPWSFDGDGALFRLVSEAHRIRLAYLFDPLLAVHTSLVEPLPHQITAVYGEMLPRQPLRFLLADEALENEGRKGTVGFALTILQRRLASSPEAIYQSLRRRRERLEKRLREEQLLKRGAEVELRPAGLPVYSLDDLDDLDDAPDAEVEETEEKVVDQATAARTIAELKTEIAMLAELERAALKLRQSGCDRKWDELSKLLQNNSEMFDAQGHRRKLVIFTEHRDTLNYLAERITAL